MADLLPYFKSKLASADPNNAFILCDFLIAEYIKRAT